MLKRIAVAFIFTTIVFAGSSPSALAQNMGQTMHEGDMNGQHMKGDKMNDRMMKHEKMNHQKMSRTRKHRKHAKAHTYKVSGNGMRKRH
jgi:hypothetical protein